MKRTLVFISLIAAALFTDPFLTTGHSESPKKIKLGAVLSLTGMASSHGNAIREGLEYAKSTLEKDGWEIDISYEDDGTEPKRTVVAVQRLAADGNKYFIGPTWGMLAIPAAPIFSRTKALSLQPCNSSDFVKGVNDRYFFFFTPPTQSQQLLTDFISKYRVKKVAILNNVSSWGDLWEELFRKAVKDGGGELVDTKNIQFSEGESGIPSILSQFKQKGVEIILSTTSKELTAFTIAQLEQQNMKTVLLSPDLIDTIKEKLSSTESRWVEGYTVIPVVDSSYKEGFKAKYGHEPYKYSESAYDSLIALAAGISAAGDDPDKVKDYFSNTLDIKGYAGRIKFTQSHDIEGAGYEIDKVVSLK